VNATPNVIVELSPLAELPCIKAQPTHPVLLFYAFYLGSLEAETTVDWWMSLSAETHTSIFASIEFLLDSLKFAPGQSETADRAKEAAFAVHSSVLAFIRLIYGDLDVKPQVTMTLYHFLWLNLCLDEYVTIIDLLSELIELDVTWLFNHSRPPLPKFIERLLLRSRLSSHVSKFFITLFECDSRVYGDNERSLCVCCRALSVFGHGQLQSVRLVSQSDVVSDIVALINRLANAEERLNRPNINLEEKLAWMLERVRTLRPSPDAYVAELQKLADCLQSNSYIEEEIQARILIIAVIAEYLTVQGRIKQYWGTLHPSTVFASLCSAAEMAAYEYDECPKIECFCDTKNFSFCQFMVNVTSLQVCAIANKNGYEQVFELTDIMWPIYDDSRFFRAGAVFVQLQFALLRVRADIPPDTDRLFGHYFRVAFYGAGFAENNGKTFIYREKNLTHLYELTTRLQTEFNAMIGSPIELIKESGTVDTASLKPDVNYVQLTFVETYFPKKDLWMRVTSYDTAHRLKTFYFDTPFTKGSDKAQGALDQQWIRRTLMTVEKSMPSILKFAPVLAENITIKDFMPIRVTFRMLRERVAMLDRAIAAMDYRQIQQLLHGSLLVQVNEGPSKMAEVFLDGQDVDPKYAAKLRECFRQFLVVNKNGLEAHSKWVSENTAFRPLQEELEAGYESLRDKLRKFL
jgi:hypothetical protein